MQKLKGDPWYSNRDIGSKDGSDELIELGVDGSESVKLEPGEECADWGSSETLELSESKTKTSCWRLDVEAVFIQQPKGKGGR